MDTNKLFEVSYSWYEEYCPTLFLGPENITEEEFSNLCKCLLPVAARNAVLKTDSWVGWHEIVDALIEMLEERNFIKIVPKKFDCWGTSIIRKKDLTEYGETSLEILAEALDLIEKHNKKIEDRCDKQISED